ncbi:MAG: aminodeoxychorismate lyase [Marinobacter sp.]|uniref:aminodeoxychorismate lyase n=1 Tax=Marinobacter sp. TaxID=50741 RepID=UPI00299E59F0|nr:aminodeoxychorismate lyase [Marinobacter sp.]MDX1757127.1 aminodeoxychorismate lyase [Marinobacter sp.]
MLKVFWAEQTPVAASDRGLAYGDGLFETIRVHRGRPVLLGRHLRRMRDGARRLGIPLSAVELEHWLNRALARYDQDGDWVLKLILTRGSGGRGYVPPDPATPHLIISRHGMPALPDPGGVVAHVARHTLEANPALAGLKSLNRLDQVLASRELPAGAYEVLMTDSAGNLLEGGRTNVLLHLRSGWFVPPANSVAVWGVMQEYVAERLDAQGTPVRERRLPLSLLGQPDFQGLFLLNSVVGVVPVRRIGCQHLPIDNSLATICDPLTSLK